MGKGGDPGLVDKDSVKFLAMGEEGHLFDQVKREPV